MNILLFCLLLHFIADFVLQSREMGKNKSSSYKWLGLHLLIQFGVFLPIGFKFAFLNALIHGIVDKNIWNLYKLSVKKRFPLAMIQSEKFEYYNDHLFYTTIGFDQLLHISTIVILLEILK